MTIFANKYKLHYNKLEPCWQAPAGDFSAPQLLAITPLERARKSLAQNQAAQPAPETEKPEKPHLPHRPEKAEKPRHKEPEPPQERPEAPEHTERTKHTHAGQTARRTAQKRRSAQPQIKSKRVKRPPIITATVTGLLLSAIVLLAATGLYGAYCYAHGTYGDVNVTASTALYALAVFVGCFWASAVVKRRSKLPPIIIGAVYILISLVISARLFELADFKLLMVFQKILFTAVAGFAGYALSLIPYLINRAIKHNRHQA